ncbi:ArsR family transcriptional regulator [Candidatus Saccharibacteria bacterium]|nr:ArsR family transcriptional regulator [Candidatus Saccharibacteria bacterium]MCB9821486.1 ArsR family transcriptional regulator [Candidatus Nomurabacteria bacterium]
MKNILDLSDINLSRRDTSVYEGLLAAGPSSIRQIAELTKINRGSVYESIKLLEKEGLISFTQKGKQKRYFAEEPEKIIEIIQHKRNELNGLAKDTIALLPKLKQRTSKIVASNVRFYEGADGLAVILRDVLTTVEKLSNKNYQVISSKPMREYLYKKFPSFTKQRIEKGIHVDVIAVGEGGDTPVIANRKWLPAKASSPSSYTIIYGSKVAIIGLTATKHSYGTITEDEGVANMQRLLFENLWQVL